MSWNYTVHQINRSLEQMALWYQDFLRRSEAAFRALHERIIYLEQQHQASQAPSDEQVERILRKILAERFGEGATQSVPHPGQAKDMEYFVKPPDSTSIPQAPLIDPKTLLVDPEAVPSKAYGQTLQMLEKGLKQYPQAEVAKSALEGVTVKDEGILKRPDLPPDDGRPW